MRDFNLVILLPAICCLGALVGLMLANVMPAVLIWVCTGTQRMVNRQWLKTFRQ